MENTTSIGARIRDYVRENFLYMRPHFELGEDDALLESGVIDSMGVMELIGFLESEFDLVIADEAITEDNLGSLGAITRFVAARSARAA
jgi:acyl carrier protein